jgi:polysaccharide biosynthesis PFTS motif protein
MMRGHRILNKSGRLHIISEIKNSFLEKPIITPDSLISSYVINENKDVTDKSTNQYVLLRFCGIGLNKVLLRSVVNPETSHAFALPNQFLVVLEKYGFNVSFIKSRIAWSGIIIFFYAYGVFEFIKLLNTIIKLIFSKNMILKNYVYFAHLSQSNLPEQKDNRSKYNIIDWYLKWDKNISHISSICHNISGTKDYVLSNKTIQSINPLCPMKLSFTEIGMFIVEGNIICFLAFVSLMRGHWWDALMLSESIKSCLIKLQKSETLARKYFFHNSSYSYRPLWTYEAEVKNSLVYFYFYSTNNQGMKTTKGYPELNYGWKSLNWPNYLIWNNYQVDFLKRAGVDKASVEITGQIPFVGSSKLINKIPNKTIAVFDVSPIRLSKIQPISIENIYVTPELVERFICDCKLVATKFNYNIAWKQKRPSNYNLHTKYKGMIKQYVKSKSFLVIDPNVSAAELILNCHAVISLPFTSTGLVAKYMNIPSIYYDPSGIIMPDDRAAQGVPILTGKEAMEDWLSNL